VLLRHPSAFAALAVAGALVTLAAASAPFVTNAAASAALKDKLSALSPLATGLQINGGIDVSTPAGMLIKNDDRRRGAADDLGQALGLKPPVFTIESEVLNVDSAQGSAQVRLMARSGALAHAKRLSSVPGTGVWVADLTARGLGLRPGDRLRIEYGNYAAASRSVSLRIKGIYRALDRSAPSPYWANFLAEVLPRGVDPPPPARYVFLSRAQLFAIAHRLGAGRFVRGPGPVPQRRNGFSVTTKAELAVDPRSLTLAQARRLEGRFAAVRRSLGTSALGRRLGCVPHGETLSADEAGSRSACRVISSLSSAVALADASTDSVSPGVSLLSGACAAIALAVSGAAGLFLVRRRRTEASLAFARGESTAAFGARTGIEILLPTLLGGAAGFAIAPALTGVLAPSGSIDSGTVRSALGHGGVALAAGFVLAVVVASSAFVRLFDSGRGRLRWLRFVPWELPLLGVALWLLLDVLGGGGLVTNHKTGASHPTLAVFVFPLLLAAATAGLVARAAGVVLRRTARSDGQGSTSLFLVTRRLAAARGTLVALAVVSAAAFGAYFYASAVQASLVRGIAEKGYVAYGGDVQGVVSDSAAIAPSFPFPATRVDYANQVATLGTPDGAYADVLAVDAGSIGSVIHWYRAWGRDPRPSLGRLARPQDEALPVLAAGDLPSHLASVWINGARLPVDVVATVRTFPGMAVGTPLLVVDRHVLAKVAAARDVPDALGTPQTLVWATGPSAAVVRALEARPLEASYVSTIDQFRKDPDVVLAKRTLGYMRFIALAAGLLVLIALVLYLQSRQRSQVIASSLAARMGLTRRAEITSLALELGLIALCAGLVGGIVAIFSAGAIVTHIDPLASDPPAPTLAVPMFAIAASITALVVAAVVAGAVVTVAARRTDLSEALRVG
jgi:putative ABC transport system permease protein